MSQQQQSAPPPPPQEGATIPEPQPREQRHPYFMATITPAGGLIVHMHWLDQPMEPMAFTNDADFSAWLKGAMSQLAMGRIPPGVRPRHAHVQVQGRQAHSLPLPDDEMEFEPMPNVAQQQAKSGSRLGARLGGLLGGRS